MRAINTVTVTFGLVTVPMKVYTSASGKSVSFNMLSKNGNRVKQSYVDVITGDPVEQKDCNKGYEYEKDKYVSFTVAELKSLESARSKTIEIKEFVDTDSIDLALVEKTYYLGPDKGGDKSYKLLAETMKALGKAAVAQWNARGKEQLVVIRPYKNGLALHQMFYANEVHNFDEAVEVAEVKISDLERNMAAKLVQALSAGDFKPGAYTDGYVKRIQDAVDRKVAGIPLEAPTETPVPSAMDLFETLKASLASVKKEGE